MKKIHFDDNLELFRPHKKSMQIDIRKKNMTIEP